MLNIIADENLALVDYFFAPFGKIRYKAGRSITARDLVQADVLLVRSVTPVNAALLHGSRVKFVGSATIGTDHVDLDYLAQARIAFANAPGCNAQAVAEYVITAILHLHPHYAHAGSACCLGIVGLGNVGQRLAYLAQQLGWRVVGTDPVQQLAGIENLSLALVLQQADVLSVHVPLTQHGPFATYHLLNATTLAQLKPDALLINTSRGAVVSEQALLADIKCHQRQVVLDVFEHEPVIADSLLQHLALATPHIAGYSLEGKARGSQMIYEAFCQYLGLTATRQFESQCAAMPQWFDSRQPLSAQLPAVASNIYQIAQDDAALRAALRPALHTARASTSPQKPVLLQTGAATAFDALRKQYPLRREWSAYGWQGCLR